MTALIIFIVGLSICLIGYLLFWNLQLQIVSAEEEPKIEPFTAIVLGTPCLKCLRVASNQKINEAGLLEAATGPGVPMSCQDKNCKAKNFSHLHVRCFTCQTVWFMATADSKIIEEDIEDIEEDKIII